MWSLVATGWLDGGIVCAVIRPSLREPRFAQAVREDVEVLLPAEREPIAKLGEPQCRIEPAELLHPQPGLIAPSGTRISGGEDADRQRVIRPMSRGLLGP